MHSEIEKKRLDQALKYYRGSASNMFIDYYRMDNVNTLYGIRYRTSYKDMRKDLITIITNKNSCYIFDWEDNKDIWNLFLSYQENAF